jgi:hypothetical protein
VSRLTDDIESELNAATGRVVALVLSLARQHEKGGANACACELCGAAERYKAALTAWGRSTAGHPAYPDTRARHDRK